MMRGRWIDLGLAVVALWLVFGPVPSLRVVGPSTPPLIVMLHEVNEGELPAYAKGAANELVAAGREVRMVDDDITDGDEPPEWLKPALEPGRAIMGPSQKDDALVLLDGQKVVKAIKLPATKEAIVEACK